MSNNLETDGTKIITLKSSDSAKEPQNLKDTVSEKSEETIDSQNSTSDIVFEDETAETATDIPNTTTIDTSNSIDAVNDSDSSNASTEGSDETPVFPDEVDDKKEPFDVGDVRSSRILSGLGYLVFFFPLLVRNSKFARFHANQALLFLITEFILLPVIAIAVIALGGIGILLGTVLSIVGLFAFTYGTAIYAMISAFSGKAKRIPLLGRVTLIKDSNEIDSEELIDFERLVSKFKPEKKGVEWETCPHCHASILKDSSYCSHCGEKLL